MLSNEATDRPSCCAGRPTRFAYLADTDIGACAKTATLVVQGIVKLDLTKPGDDSIVARISHGPSVRGGEAFFVPAHPDPAHCQGDSPHNCVCIIQVYIIRSPRMVCVRSSWT